MSCIVLSDHHISALVSWAVAHGVDLGASPDAVAHMLASANRRAYSDRYAGRYDSELVPFGGLDRSAGVDLDPVVIVKACDCLDYQASDWSRWTDSDAFGYMVAIRRAAVAAVHLAAYQAAPKNYKYTPDPSGRALPGYDAAAWTLDAPEPRPIDSVADRLAAVLCDMSEPELAAIRSALVAVAADRRAAELARGAA
jgi:hypothetical protein